MYGYLEAEHYILQVSGAAEGFHRSSDDTCSGYSATVKDPVVFS